MIALIKYTLLLLFICSCFCCCRLKVNSLSVISKVNTENLQLYKSLLPAGASMPDTPLVKFEGIGPEGSSYYLESNISIRLIYNKQHYWYPLIMPLNNKLGYQGGLPYGYPKVLVDACQLKTSTNNLLQYNYTVDFDKQKNGCDTNTCAAHLSFTEYKKNMPGVFWNDDLVREQGLSIAPRDSVYVSTRLTYTKSKEKNYYGTVQLINRYKQPWNTLLPSGTYSGLFMNAALGNLKMITINANTGATYTPPHK
jgi:hypothetical protein